MPQGFWKERENRRKLFDELQRKLLIKKPSDWGNISYTKLKELKGTRILTYYGGSLIKALMSIYPGYFEKWAKYVEVEWKLQWFSKAPRKYWQDEINQRKVFEEIGKKFNILNPKDWSKLNSKTISDNGGGIILGMYGGSLYKALQTSFPG